MIIKDLSVKLHEETWKFGNGLDLQNRLQRSVSVVRVCFRSRLLLTNSAYDA